MSQDSFEVPPSAAATQALLRIERHNRVSTLPNSFVPGITPETYAVSQRPHANQLLQLIARGGNAGGHGVGVIEDAYRSGQTARRQCPLQIETLHLMQVGRVLDDSV